MQLSDSVYLLHEPRDQEPPQLEVVFVHGLQAWDFKDAYWKTWLVRDGSKFPSDCWPASWLKERMPRARILSLSYDSSALVAPIKGNRGTMDLDILGESLLQEMLSARIGQKDCPVVFVCHSLGGLVVKSIVSHARKPSTFADEYKALLQNTKGFFFYATPHLGSELVEYAKKICTLYNFKGAVVENLEVLCKNTSDFNTGFEQAHRSDFQHWKCCVIGESHKTRLVSEHQCLFMFYLYCYERGYEGSVLASPPASIIVGCFLNSLHLFM